MLVSPVSQSPLAQLLRCRAPGLGEKLTLLSNDQDTSLARPFFPPPAGWDLVSPRPRLPDIGIAPLPQVEFNLFRTSCS